MTDRICSVVDCGRTHRARGLCTTHWKRWRAKGDALPATPVRPKQWSGDCRAEGCDSRIESQGFCRMHYYRMKRRGTVEEYARGLAEANPKWIGDAAGYRAVHTRLHKTFGRAASHPCIDCAGQANDWSYDHADPNERYDDRGCPFSTDLSRYQPRCKRCHSIFDEVAFKSWEKRRAS